MNSAKQYLVGLIEKTVGEFVSHYEQSSATVASLTPNTANLTLFNFSLEYGTVFACPYQNW